MATALRPSVMIIDDNKQRRRAITAKLCRAGYETAAVATRDVFRPPYLDHFERPDVVLMDTSIMLEPLDIHAVFKDVPVCVYGDAFHLQNYMRPDIGFYGDMGNPVLAVRTLLGEKI